MIDSDLAALYGVALKVMNQAVKRNIQRFPADFCFQLTAEEWTNLRSQIVTFSKDSRKYKPYAYTEHGILMLSSVLNSDKAIDIKIQIMRIFVRMRHYAISKNATDEQIAELRKLLLLCIEKTINPSQEGVVLLSLISGKRYSLLRRQCFNFIILKSSIRLDID